MPSTSSQTLKLKSTLRLLIPRLRMAQKKDTTLSISSRREMSVLLAQSREASARIRVENIIQTDICVELMEILELYAELLLARAGLLDAREKSAKEDSSGGAGGVAVADTGLEEAAASIIYAAPRLPREVRELGIVRNLLVERFGKEFALRCNVEGGGGGGLVPKRVVEKLTVEAPRAELVEAYLREIARTYGVEWPPPQDREEEDDDDDDEDERQQREMAVLGEEVDNDDNDDDEEEDARARHPTRQDAEGEKIMAALSTPVTSIKPTSIHLINRSPVSTTTHALPTTPKGAKSPISVAPPAPRSDNPSPQLKLPGGEQQVGKKGVTAAAAAAATKPSVGAGAGKKNVVGGVVPDVDELAKRFSMLKR